MYTPQPQSNDSHIHVNLPPPGLVYRIRRQSSARLFVSPAEIQSISAVPIQMPEAFVNAELRIGVVLDTPGFDHDVGLA